MTLEGLDYLKIPMTPTEIETATLVVKAQIHRMQIQATGMRSDHILCLVVPLRFGPTCGIRGITFAT
jgi:hypothetical protein